jgi:hypothetical protein
VTPTKPVTPSKPVKPTGPITDPNDPNYDCTKDPNVKVNWDKECINKNKPWYDKTLFKVSDFDFTIGDAVLATSTIIIVACIAFAISSYIAWKKRKAIAAGARRMSASIRRMSTRLRESFALNKVANAENSDEDVNAVFGTKEPT